jgi:outer membrane protein assembly factor BamB
MASALALALAGCGSLDKINPFSTDKKALAPLPALVGGEDLPVAWRASIGSAGEYGLSPAVNGDSVYAAGRDGSVARFDDGRQVWRASVGATVSGGVGSDGKRVVVGTPKAEVIALDAVTGKTLWTARAGSEVLAAPALADGIVVVRSGDSRIVALDATDGKRRWIYQRTTPPLSLRSSVGVRIEDGKVLAGFPGGKMAVIALTTGAVIWEGTVALPKGATELERVTDVTSEPVLVNGIACSVAYQGKLACFEASNGNAIWTRDISSSMGIDADNRYVYAVDEEGVLDALDRVTGASVWRQDKLKGRGVGRPLALGERVAVADSEGVVHLLRRSDGALVGRTRTDAGAIRVPLTAQAGRVVVQAADGALIALRLQ